MERIVKNSQFYKNLVTDSFNEIYTFDAVSYKFIFLNTSALNNLGYTMEEMIELTPINIKPDHDINSFEKLILPLRNKKKTKIQFYTNHKRKNGTFYPVEVHLQLNSKGKNQYFSAFIIDITERKLAENNLKMSEAKFKDLFEKSDDALLIIKNNIFVDCNIATSKMLGYASKNEFINVHPSKLSPKIQPDGKESFKKSEETMSIAFKKGSHRFEWMHTKKSGEDFPVEVLLTTIHNEQNNKVIYCVWRDITERKFQEIELKKSEKSLLEAQRIAKIGSYNLDLKTNVVETSAVFNEIVGIDSNCVLTFALWRTITHPEDIPTNQKALEKCLKTGEKFDLEYRILTKNTQELKWIHGLGEVIYKNGKPTNFFGTIQDITQKKITEIDLQKAYSEVERLKNQLLEENISLKDEIALSFNYEDMVYSSLEFSEVLTQVEQVSKTDATVLILGETGTGKELIAKAIHNISDRKDKPLIRVNCAAIPTELIESELFGHIKGSFTGAINNRIGKFELANKGTLFLDEIGEMPLALQPKLLRAIQEGEIEPIGSSKIRKLNVRIIAATNKDLKKEAEEKRFREDLYFRLNVFPITIPPLRERIEDIPTLIDYFVKKYCKKYGKEIKYISEATAKQMKSYNWPGNVRELENLIERAVIISNEDYLIINEFNNNQIKKTIIKHNTVELEEIQHNHIIKILEESQWKIEGKKGAAVKLNIKPSTLRDRMKKLGITRPKK
ncbi:MAG: sigma 54-interacting transcriptional regulator [Flavobacteriaceae bacterium]|nr:sigma 54-interacting transcriptional regulator [Flavobacteriaceae bacterium]